MSQDQRFNHLLEIYLGNQAGPDEYCELMVMIKSGLYDDLLRQKIQGPFDNESQLGKLDFERSRRMLNKIFAAERNTEELIPVSSRIPKWKYWSVAASVLIIIGFGTSLLWRPQMNKGKSLARNYDLKNQPITHKTQTKYIRLPDGSTVLLNKNSSLEYPENFNGNTREVTLIGEGYFDIQHNLEKSFIVQAGNVQTTVLGTAFS